LLIFGHFVFRPIKTQADPPNAPSPEAFQNMSTDEEKPIPSQKEKPPPKEKKDSPPDPDFMKM